MATLEDLAPEARDELALLARELSDSPETRKDFLRLVKARRPNMPVPELEMEAALSRNTDATNATVQRLEGKLAERDMRDELQRRRDALVSEGKVSSKSDVAEVEKIMLEKGITSHETAADYWNWMKQAATPTPTGYAGNVLDTDVKSRLAPYWKNPASAARDEATRALTELRKGGPRVLS